MRYREAPLQAPRGQTPVCRTRVEPREQRLSSRLGEGILFLSGQLSAFSYQLFRTIETEEVNAMANYGEVQQDQLYKLRHSAAHVMAQAVLELYPEVKIAIGPPIENGFYYDFDLGKDES